MPFLIGLLFRIGIYIVIFFFFYIIYLIIKNTILWLFRTLKHALLISSSESYREELLAKEKIKEEEDNAKVDEKILVMYEKYFPNGKNTPAPQVTYQKTLRLENREEEEVVESKPVLKKEEVIEEIKEEEVVESKPVLKKEEVIEEIKTKTTEKEETKEKPSVSKILTDPNNIKGMISDLRTEFNSYLEECKKDGTKVDKKVVKQFKETISKLEEEANSLEELMKNATSDQKFNVLSKKLEKLNDLVDEADAKHNKAIQINLEIKDKYHTADPEIVSLLGVVRSSLKEYFRKNESFAILSKKAIAAEEGKVKDNLIEESYQSILDMTENLTLNIARLDLINEKSVEFLINLESRNLTESLSSLTKDVNSFNDKLVKQNFIAEKAADVLSEMERRRIAREEKEGGIIAEYKKLK